MNPRNDDHPPEAFLEPPYYEVRLGPGHSNKKSGGDTLRQLKHPPMLKRTTKRIKE